MTQVIGLTLLLMIAAGLAIHAGVQFPWYFEWFGTLPGDIIIKKDSLTLYLPVTSSLIISVALSIFLSLFSKR